jgi:transposase
MLKIEFAAKDVDALEYERLHHPHPRVQQKMWAVWMKAQGLPHHQICQLSSISENTLRSYLREFLESGVERLKELSFYKPTSALDAHRETLEVFFRENPPMSAAQAREEIHRLTGIRRGLTQTREYLHRLGLDFRKVGAVPAKADPNIQDEFKKNSWSPSSKRRRIISAPFTS